MGTKNGEEKVELLEKETKNYDSTKPLLEEPTQAFKRNLTFTYCFVTVVGCMIGSGLFVSPALVARRTPNSFIAICVWIFSGFISLIGCLCYCELTSLIKKTGSTYIFVHETYGRYVSLPLLLSILFVLMPFGFYTVLLSASTYACTPFFENKDSKEFLWATRLVAIIMLYIMALVSGLGAKSSAKIQVGISSVQIGSIVLLMTGAIYYIAKTGDTYNLTPNVVFNNTVSGFKNEFPAIGSSIFSALFCFDGWWVIASFAEEIKNPKKHLILVASTSIPFVTFLYTIVNLSCLAMLSHEETGESDVVFINAFKKVGIPHVEYIIPVFVFVSSLSTVVGGFFYQSRFILSAAREGQLPKFLSLIHSKTGTPLPAVFLISFVTTLVAATDFNIETALQAYNAALWLELLLAFTTVLYLRVKKPNAERAYKVWITTPIFMCITASFLICILFYTLPWSAPLFLVIITFSAIVNRFYFGSTRNFNLDFVSDWLVRRTNFVLNRYDQSGWEDANKEKL